MRSERDGLSVLLPELRRLAALSQRATADALGCSLPTVQRLETAEGSCSLDRLFDLADVLGISGTQLMALIDGAEALDPDQSVRDWLEGLVWAPGPGRLQRPQLIRAADASIRQVPVSDQDPDLRILSAEAASALRKRRRRLVGLVLGVIRRRIDPSRDRFAKTWGGDPPDPRAPSSSTLKRIELGKGSPGLGALRLLRERLGLSRVELVALVEDLAEHNSGVRLSAKNRANFISEFEQLIDRRYEWEPNPRGGLLTSRLAGFDFRVAPREPSGRAAEVEPAPAQAARTSRKTQGTRSGRLHEQVVAPAATALSRSLRRGYGAVVARVPWIPDRELDVVGRIAEEVIRQLAHAGWKPFPALLLRAEGPQGAASTVQEISSGGPSSQVVVVVGDQARTRLAAGDADGAPWRLVLADGLSAATGAGLHGRQPSHQLFGAALVVIETTLAERAADLKTLTARPQLDWEYTSVQAMDAGLLPPLHFRGVDVPRPPEADGPKRTGSHRLADSVWRDGSLLETLATAAPFQAGARSLLHVANAGQIDSLREWIARQRQLNSAHVEVAARSASGLALSPPLNGLVLLAGDHPRTLLGQVDAALRHASLEAGLNILEVEPEFAPEAAKRRNALRRALGGGMRGDKGERAGTWKSPGGNCTFRWTMRTTEAGASQQAPTRALAEALRRAAPGGGSWRASDDSLLRDTLARRGMLDRVSPTLFADIVPVEVDPSVALADLAAELAQSGLSGPILWVAESKRAADYGRGLLKERGLMGGDRDFGPLFLRGRAQVVVTVPGDIDPMEAEPAVVLLDGFKAAGAAWRKSPILRTAPTVVLASPLENGPGRRAPTLHLPVSRRDELDNGFSSGRLAPFKVWLLESTSTEEERHTSHLDPKQSMSLDLRLAPLKFGSDRFLPRAEGPTVYFAERSEMRALANHFKTEGGAVLDEAALGARKGPEVTRLADEPTTTILLSRPLDRIDNVPRVARIVFLKHYPLPESRLLPLLRAASRAARPVQVVEFVEPTERKKRLTVWERTCATGQRGEVAVAQIPGG